MSLSMQCYACYHCAAGLASAVPFVGNDAGYYRVFSARGRVGSIVPLDAHAAAHAAEAWLPHGDPDNTRHCANTVQRQS